MRIPAIIANIIIQAEWFNPATYNADFLIEEFQHSVKMTDSMPIISSKRLSFGI